MTNIGHFGFHPDPAIDFCCEVDALEGMAVEVRNGMAERSTLHDRLSIALAFQTGGDVHAVSAKRKLVTLAEAFEKA